MNKITWNHAKIPIGDTDIINVQTRINFTFPEDFKELIINHNSANPDKRGIDTLKTKGREFLRLLSVRPQDKSYIPGISDNVEFLQKSLVPIATDSGGDFFCYDKLSPIKAIVFWDHETSEIEFVAKNITELLEKLYK